MASRSKVSTTGPLAPKYGDPILVRAETHNPKNAETQKSPSTTRRRVFAGSVLLTHGLREAMREGLFYDDGTHRGCWSRRAKCVLVFERGELTGCFDQAELLAATKDGGLRLQGPVALGAHIRVRAVDPDAPQRAALLSYLPDPTPFLIAIDYFVENGFDKPHPDFVTGRPVGE